MQIHCRLLPLWLLGALRPAHGFPGDEIRPPLPGGRPRSEARVAWTRREPQYPRDPSGSLLPADGDGAAGGPPRPDDEAASVPRPARLTVVSTEETLLVAGMLDNNEDDQAATKENVTITFRFRPLRFRRALPLPLRLGLGTVETQSKAAAGNGEDRLSELPNDFLLNILERVGTLDAADLQQHQPHYIMSIPLVYETLYMLVSVTVMLSSIQRQILASSPARKTVALALIRISFLFMEAKKIYEV
ncbi:hypothetical protein ZWY2020_056503 [Hordeum vulgare]|nr:hypothetical protein ZWY2020_056503 [Hordeum vulgare]